MTKVTQLRSETKQFRTWAASPGVPGTRPGTTVRYPPRFPSRGAGAVPGRRAPDRPADAAPAEEKPEQAAPEASPPEEIRAVAILKSGVVDGMGYTLYVDGSIEAELPQGTLRFASINELRAHLEKTS